MPEHASPSGGADFTDFVCICSDEGRDGADALVLEVVERLAAGSEELSRDFGTRFVRG